MSATSLLVGIGSPYGDDSVGWEIANRVADHVGDAIRVRCASTPAELLDWLDGVDVLDVCDAVASGGEIGSVFCWHWPAAEIEHAPFGGSHDLSLPAALALAETLGRLPAHVRIWGVAIAPGRALGPLSPAVAAAVPKVVERICGARSHA